MGIAAYQRGSALIRKEMDESARLVREREAFERSCKVEHQVSEWRREAWILLEDARHGDKKGFLGRNIERLSQLKRASAFVRKIADAQLDWIDAQGQGERTETAIRWAQAVYDYLDWARGMCRCELLDRAPTQIRRHR